MPWLSSRLQLGASRTFWIFIALAMLLTLLFNNHSFSYTFYMIVGMIVVVFLFATKVFLRSGESVFILLFGFFLNYSLVSARFWPNAVGASYPFVKVVLDDLLALLPLAIVAVVVWAVGRLPARVAGDAAKTAFASWAGLGRATTLMMVVACGGAAVAVGNVVDQYVVHRVVNLITKDEAVLKAGLGKIGGTTRISLSGPIVVNPITRKPLRDSAGRVMRANSRPFGQLKPLIDEAVGGSAYLRGIKEMIPRLMIAMFGYAAFAALVGYVVARARKRGIVFAAVGTGAVIIVHWVWSSFANAPGLTPAMALLAFIAGIAVVVAGIQAIDLDRRAGFAVTARQLGTSFAMARRTGSLSMRAPGP